MKAGLNNKYDIAKILGKAFKIVSRQAVKNAMYCHLKSYSCTSSGTRILPESRKLWQYPSATAK